MEINKGVFGLYNYEDTALEVKDEEKFSKKIWKAIGQGAVNTVVINGIIYTGLVVLACILNKDSEE